MKPLEGIRVLDLSRILAGPLCTMWLADLGAEVIKVERPDGGDETRRWGPPFVAGESAYFLAVNRGKYGIALDLTTPTGQEILRKLVEKSDVVVHNFLPATAEKLGVTYEAVRRLNPRAVYLSILGFPPGPYREEPGFDALIQALGGLMAITGEDARPAKVGVAIVDVLTAWAGLCGVLGALLLREKTGEGMAVEATLIENSAAALVNVAQAFLLTKKEPKRLGTAHPQIVPYQAFPAADGLLMVAVGTDAQFRALCAVLGRPELADDPRFATNPARVQNRELLLPLLEEILLQRPRAFWIQELKRAGVPAGPVNSLSDLFGDPGLVGRILLEVEHPSVGRYPTLVCPVSLAWPGSPLPPPRLGEHTELVLRRLGLA
ncbi:MAG: CoA transferase [Candidatus Bipolaricaulota bacterium]|nr:CoA transferase [Candidatus Bipolaricaulota bacterium]MDW8152234.1 CoA transferase [Candidatus Bipolaricaulota bacterium]